MPVCLAISRHWRFTSLASALRQRPAQRRNQPATRSKAPSGARRDPAIGSAPSPTDAAEELGRPPWSGATSIGAEDVAIGPRSNVAREEQGSGAVQHGRGVLLPGGCQSSRATG